jgi:hypothetical protein
MDVDRRLEQLCERVALVEGVGSLRRGELCVMSFVALLAGERHTNHPASDIGARVGRLGILG